MRIDVMTHFDNPRGKGGSLDDKGFFAIDLLARGVDGIITNAPDRVHALIGSTSGP